MVTQVDEPRCHVRKEAKGIEYPWGEGDPERTKTAAAELVRSAPDAIVVAGGQFLDELQRLTSTTPIVFTQIGDPVAAGFVSSLARPGGNVTGFQAFEPAMGGKWLGVPGDQMRLRSLRSRVLSAR